MTKFFLRHKTILWGALFFIFTQFSIAESSDSPTAQSCVSDCAGHKICKNPAKCKKCIKILQKFTDTVEKETNQCKVKENKLESKKQTILPKKNTDVSIQKTPQSKPKKPVAVTTIQKKNEIPARNVVSVKKSSECDNDKLNKIKEILDDSCSVNSADCDCEVKKLDKIEKVLDGPCSLQNEESEKNLDAVIEPQKPSQISIQRPTTKSSKPKGGVAKRATKETIARRKALESESVDEDEPEFKKARRNLKQIDVDASDTDNDE